MACRSNARYNPKLCNCHEREKYVQKVKECCNINITPHSVDRNSTTFKQTRPYSTQTRSAQSTPVEVACSAETPDRSRSVNEEMARLRKLAGLEISGKWGERREEERRGFIAMLETTLIRLLNFLIRTPTIELVWYVVRCASNRYQQHIYLRSDYMLRII